MLASDCDTWDTVISWVPQGSILAPGFSAIYIYIYIYIYVNDLPDMVKNTAKMFSNDTKLYKAVENKSDCDQLQSYLNALLLWSRT